MRSSYFSVQTELHDEQDDYEVISVTDKGAIFKGPFNELIWMETENALDMPIGDILISTDGKLWV